MAYGDGYKERDYNQGLDEGDYEIILGLPVDTNKSGYDMRIIPISIIGHENCYPKEWTWFDRPSDQEMLVKWEKAMTRNCDAFGVRRGDFTPSSWNGRRGIVHIGKDKDGKFMKVLWSVVQDGSRTENRSDEPPIDSYGDILF